VGARGSSPGIQAGET